MDGTVLVIGATGQQGGAAARALLDRGRAVHVLVRDVTAPAALALEAAGATLVPGDLDDPASLRAAMEPARGVFLVLTMMTGPKVTLDGVAAEERRGRSVAELAKETGVDHLVYSSVAGADRHTGIPHYESKGRIEGHLRSLGVPTTILRPVFFMENFHTLARPVIAGDELIVKLAVRQETLLPLISTRDIGAFAAAAFELPDLHGRALEIAGDVRTGPEIAASFGRAHRLPARFQQTPLEQVRAFDERVAQMFEWMDTRTADPVDLPALRRYHPGLLTLDRWLDTETRKQ